VLFVIAFAGDVSAQPDTTQKTFEFAPKEGKPGRVVAVSGTGCTLDGHTLEWADVDFSRNVAEGGGEPFRASGRYPVKADGSWDGEFVVPAETPPGPYFFNSSCAASDFVVVGVDAEFPVLPRPPAVVTSKQSTVRAGDQVDVSAASCLFEDGTAARVAKLFIRDSASTVIASGEAPVDSSGVAAGAMRLPARVASLGTASVEVRCEGPLGAMVGRSAAVTIGAAIPVRPPKVTLTG
jgi:hypothetical protein